MNLLCLFSAEYKYMANRVSPPQRQHQSLIDSETYKKASAKPYSLTNVLKSHHQHCVLRNRGHHGLGWDGFG
jgi:hypothetical protein